MSAEVELRMLEGSEFMGRCLLMGLVAYVREISTLPNPLEYGCLPLP